MRRFTILIALIVTMVVPMFAERVTPETARIVATTFLNNNGAKSNQLVDLSKAAGFQNLYIFSTENSFVVMAADNCVKPILGYSLTGCFDAEDMPDNLVWWLNGYNGQIQNAIDSHTKATYEVANQWEKLINGRDNPIKVTTVVGALITTNWDQWYPYNYYCPTCDPYSNNGGHALTGCVATAMAQTINYYHAPVHGIANHSYTHSTFGQLSADFNSTNYDWTNMSTRIYSTSSSAEIQAVATLIYHCGVSVDMNYGRTTSGAFSSNIAPALKQYFNFSQSTTYTERSDYNDDDWISLMRNELNNSRPVIYGGFDNATNPSSGHSFVCDGYDADTYSSYYFHFNWGWSGSYNGYFNIDDMTPGGDGAGGGNHIYSYLQDAIIGIQPSTNNNVIPTELSYTLTGLQNLTLNWTATNRAESYNIYRNNTYIGTSTTNSFSETAPFGINVYWVRSVDANGELSLSSNTVEVTVDYQFPAVEDLAGTLSNNTVGLSWTTPQWCYPEMPSESLYYGEQIPTNSYMNWNTYTMYWGHRHLSENLTDYDGMKLYSVGFHTYNPGTYEVCIYEGTSSGTYVTPTTHISTQTITVATTGWHSIDLSTPYVVDKAKDLWIFIHNPQTINELKSYLCTSSGSYGCYYSDDPLSNTHNNITNYAFLIKAYLTDGTYTYNLYQDGTRIASNLIDTSYSGVTLNDNAANQFVIKTNYYGGEAESNMVSFAKGSTSLNSLELGTDDKMTLTENSVLTISGDVTNTDPANLILENGAQLIHNSTGVKATVKKDVAAYTSKLDGWNLVASPVTENITPSEDNGLISTLESDTIDLYYYSEPEHKWKNYQNQAFSIEYQKGYLYANNKEDGSTLSFAGTLTPSNETVTISNLSHSASTLNGINLVGNPFVCNATVNKDFYVMNDDRTKIVVPASDRQIAPCEGIFVQVSEADASVTFTKAGAKARSLSSSFDITLTQGRTTLDRARVRFEDKEGLEKFSLNENTGNQIYFPQDGKGYAVVCISEQNELPLNFEAAENGTYTLSIETENVNLRHLYLIDNLTGIETDLLKTPNYTFEAKTSDYASRFRLVYSTCEDAVGDNETFAFVNNGQIIITNVGDAEDAYNASLQIIDMTGRMVYQGDAKHCVSTTEMALGAYVLRLIDGENVRTQKIILK